MRDLKVSFDKLEGESFETGYLVLKAVFETKSVIIKTTLKQIQELQKNLAAQLGNIYTDRFQFIQLEQLESCGGVMIDFFFEDALQCEFITHNDYFMQFFTNAQKIQPPNEEKRVGMDGQGNEFYKQQEQKGQQQQMYQPEQDNSNSQKPPININNNSIMMKPQFRDNDNSKNLPQFQKKGFQTYMMENKINPYFEEDLNEEDITIVAPAPVNNPSYPSKKQAVKSKYQNSRGKKFSPVENIYINNRELLEEKIHTDKKYIRFSKYFRRKIKSKLKFLFKNRQNLQGQLIQNCFNCCKCRKNMYFGIRCFKCKREDVYYCEDCNTKCPDCLVLLKKTNDHVNINNFHKLMRKSTIMCQACLEDIPLIKYEEHLYQCEDNYETCKYCRISFHYSALKDHINNNCEQKPVVCQTCKAKYPKCKQTSHKCIKRFYTIHNQLSNNFDNMKSFISNKFQNLDEKLYQFQQLKSQSQPNNSKSPLF